jgi:hypothetical protein
MALSLTSVQLRNGMESRSLTASKTANSTTPQIIGHIEVGKGRLQYTEKVIGNVEQMCPTPG